MSRLSVKVIPKSGRNDLKMEGKTLKVWLKSAPEDGKANAELVRTLAKHFDISRSRVTIVNGKSSRNKIVDIEGITPVKIEKTSG